jgi:methionine-S-sulfoxide reductase
MNKQSIVIGGGCFWCIEALFVRISGVIHAQSGYAGGHTQSPEYDAVCSGTTGHAEVVKLDYDSNIISLETILQIFWTMHDPTTPNRQGADIGTQYRSIVLYQNDDQKKIIEKVKQTMQSYWSEPIITEVVALEKFWSAEDYHQNYFENHPENTYCTLVINPKISKLKQTFKHLLKYD